MVPELPRRPPGSWPTCARPCSRPRRRCRRGGSPSVSVAADAVVSPEQAGTFAGYGVDVRVALSPGRRRRARRTAAVRADHRLGTRAGRPAGARRGAGVLRRPRSGCGAGPWQAAARRDRRGAPIPSACSSSPTARTPSPRRAPGGYDPDSVPVQAALDDALACGDAAALARLPDAVVGRVAYQVLAGLADRAPRSAKGALSRGALRRRDISPASGFRWAGAKRPGYHSEAARDHRPDRDRKVGAGAGGGREIERRRLGGEIVNADAMQLYRGMDIGTAKLPVAERRGVPHHQLDVLDVTETATVARYQQDAAADVERDLGRGCGADHRRRIDDVRAVAAGRVGVSGHRSGACGPNGSGGWPRSAPPRCTPSWPGCDAAAASSILPTDGRRIVRALEVVRADRGAVRGVGADHRCATLGHRHRRIGLGDRRFSTSDWRSAPTRCSPTASSTRCAALLEPRPA